MNLNGMNKIEEEQEILPTEIERKYTLRTLPPKLENITKITQKHVFKDSMCSIRVRKSENIYTKEKEYTHTIKARGANVKKFSIYELEEKISMQEYEEIDPFIGSRPIEKYRIVAPLANGLKAEIDVFKGFLKGLIIAEVEFATVEQAENFEMPSWFNEAVSHREFSNRKLSTKNRADVLGLIGSKQLNINEKIIYELKRKYIKDL